VDISQYRMLGEKPGIPTVVLATRMLRDKGVVEFVEAARDLKRQGVEARFVLAGDVDSENPAGISAAELTAWHKTGVVEWCGYCTDMLGLFSDAHIICLPSYREGAPKILMEAAACGKPAVTTNVSGCREIVHDGENGYVVPPRDSQALAAALRRLIRDPELRSLMGRKARALAEREFSVAKVIADNLNVYERFLNAQCESHSFDRM
jgi:glycosyltransferase involved in cell wall biosynthesis